MGNAQQEEGCSQDPPGWDLAVVSHNVKDTQEDDEFQSQRFINVTDRLFQLQESKYGGSLPLERKMQLVTRLRELWPQMINNRPDHPPYAEMIFSAIHALSEKEGSTETSISEYIESHWKQLPFDHKGYLSRSLGRLVSSGELIATSNGHFLFPLSERDAEGKPIKKSGLRPPKPKQSNNASDGIKDTLLVLHSSEAFSAGEFSVEPLKMAMEEVPVPMPMPPARRRGRPPKVKCQSEKMVINEQSNNASDGIKDTLLVLRSSEALSTGEFSVEPLKMAMEEVPMPMPPARRRGRPPKVKCQSEKMAINEQSNNASDGIKDTLLVLHSSEALSTGEFSVEPLKMAMEEVPMPMPPARRRGRPPKVKRQSEKMVINEQAEPVKKKEEAVVMTMGPNKRRGRPPKNRNEN